MMLVLAGKVATVLSPGTKCDKAEGIKKLEDIKDTGMVLLTGERVLWVCPCLELGEHPPRLVWEEGAICE